MAEQVEIDPNEAPLLAGWVKIRRSDVVLGGFDRRWSALYSNRIEFWKTEEEQRERPRLTPKDVLPLHLLRRLRFMDHVPGTSKEAAIELYTHSRTLYLVSDDDTTWLTWMARIDGALRASTFDMRDDVERERDLYPGHTPPPGAYVPAVRGPKPLEDAPPPLSSTPRGSDPMLAALFKKGSQSHSPARSRTSSSGQLQSQPSPRSKTPRAGETKTSSPRTSTARKKADE